MALLVLSKNNKGNTKETLRNNYKNDSVYDLLLYLLFIFLELIIRYL